MGKFSEYLHRLLHQQGRACGEECGGIVISDAALHRQTLYDAFHDAEEVCALMELPPISEEGAEMERRDSRARMEALAPVAPLLLHQAHFMAHAACAIQFSNSGADPEDVSPERIAYVHDIFTNLVTASVMSVVSTAVGLGALEIKMGAVFDD